MKLKITWIKVALIVPIESEPTPIGDLWQATYVTHPSWNPTAWNNNSNSAWKIFKVSKV